MRAPHKFLSSILALVLLLGQGLPAAGTPESSAAALFLLISPSVRVNGMDSGRIIGLDEALAVEAIFPEFVRGVISEIDQFHQS